jgi:hypothetical protein
VTRGGARRGAAQYYGFVEEGNPDDVFELAAFAARVQAAAGAPMERVMAAKADLEAGSAALVSRAGLSPAALALAESIAGSPAAARAAVAKAPPGPARGNPPRCPPRCPPRSPPRLDSCPGQ